MLAQTKQVTGKVTDENGLPLSSISVHVKNSRIGISTKIDGTFSLSVPENATLVFTGVGYLPKEVSVAGQSAVPRHQPQRNDEHAKQEDAHSKQKITMLGIRAHDGIAGTAHNG